MTSPRFQFTIAGMLWATFWLAVAGGLFCYPRSIDEWISENWTWPWQHVVHVVTIAPLMVVFCLCAAAGALVGRHRRGVAVGIIVVVGWFVWMVVFVLCDLWHTYPPPNPYGPPITPPASSAAPATVPVTQSSGP